MKKDNFYLGMENEQKNEAFFRKVLGVPNEQIFMWDAHSSFFDGAENILQHKAIENKTPFLKKSWQGTLVPTREEFHSYITNPYYGCFCYCRTETSDYFVSEDLLLEVNFRSSHSLGVSTFNVEKLESLNSYLSDNFTKQSKIKDNVYGLLPSQNGMNIETIGQGGQKLQRENYSDEVLEDYDYTVEQLSSENPLGSFFLFRGPPGTGKSYIVRGLINEVESAKFVLISPQFVSHLGDPEFISCMMKFNSKNNASNIFFADDDEPEVSNSKKESIVLIIEDADSILLKREEGNVNILSSLLNFTDGIVGQTMNIRIVCTTNARDLEFDGAITRPGRLGRLSTVGALNKEKSKKILQRIGSDTELHKNQYTLAELYAIANKSNTGKKEEQPQKKVGF